MPDRHGPIRVVYQARGDEEIPPTTWSSFEESTPNDILDRITRGILSIDTAWLGSLPLTSAEVTAVEEYFGVSIGGGEMAPADRFSVGEFSGSGESRDGGVGDVFLKANVADDDGDDDVTGFRIDATSDDDVTDSFEYLPDGTDSGASERTNFEIPVFSEQIVEDPITATLSAADVDPGDQFVELETIEVFGQQPA